MGCSNDAYTLILAKFINFLYLFIFSRLNLQLLIFFGTASIIRGQIIPPGKNNLYFQLTLSVLDGTL